MYTLQVKDNFSSAHALEGYPGKCHSLHGHNFHVAVQVQGEKLNEHGMLIDFYDLKKYLGEVIDPLDHRLLNELPEFEKLPPTAENIARHIFEGFEKKLPTGVTLLEVSVKETAKNKATYRK